MFFTKEEIEQRILNRIQKGGKPDNLAVHKNTRCGLPGFIAVGPMFNKDVGLPWFDIKENLQLDTFLKEICHKFEIHHEARIS